MSAEYVLQVQNLEKRYTLKKKGFFKKPKVVQAVRGISFRLKKGEVFACVGESGCGKSTTARLLVNLEKPTSGTIVFQGRNISDLKGKPLKELRRKVQMVLQDPFSSLPQTMTIRQILEEPLIIHGIKDKALREEQIQRVASLIRLKETDLDKYPNHFSGGQRQMINIARAIILNPDLVILDEATSALDSSVQAEILNLFDDLKKQFGLTYVVISHDLAMVRHMCDTIGVMYLGKFVEYGDNESIFSNPLHPYTRSLMNAIPSIEAGVPGIAEGTILRGEVPSPIDPPPGCSFCSRCSFKTSVCETEDPPLRAFGDSHYVACHNIEQIQMEGFK